MPFNPYITFDGNGAEALKFYSRVFGGEVWMQSFGESPMAAQFPDAKDKLMHGTLSLPDGQIMASDAVGMPFDPGARISVQRGYDDLDDAEAIFERLAEGGSITMEWGKTFWARGFGMCSDRFGVNWIINCD